MAAVVAATGTQQGGGLLLLEPGKVVACCRWTRQGGGLLLPLEPSKLLVEACCLLVEARHLPVEPGSCWWSLMAAGGA